MLESHRLASTITGVSRWWLWPYLLVLASSMAILASLWLAMVFPRTPVARPGPALDIQYEAVTQAGQQIVMSMSPEQLIDTSWFDQLQGLQAPLGSFTQALKLAALETQSRDPQTWPGRGNLLLDDLKIIEQNRNTPLQVQSLRSDLLGLYAPGGKLSAQKKPEASISRGFYATLLEWTQATALDPARPGLTWSQLNNSRNAWSRLIGQVGSLEGEARLNDDTPRMRADRELLEVLRSSGLRDRLVEHDNRWTQFSLAHERLQQLSEKLPAMPVLPEPAEPWQWSRLAYPGPLSQGILLAMVLAGTALLIQLFGHAQQARIQKRSVEQWLSLQQQMETDSRSLGQPLRQAQQHLDTTFAALRQAQDLSMQIQASPSQDLSGLEAWSGLRTLHQQTEQDLQLLRSKLFNIHLQFCNGTNQENLLYEIGFVTEGLETVNQSLRNMGRSLELLSSSIAPPAPEQGSDAQRQLQDALQNLRGQIKALQADHNDIKARLDESVGDVPQGRRFDGMQAASSNSGRSRG